MFPDCPRYNVFKVIKMLVIVVLLFGISWLPYQVLLILFLDMLHKNTPCICRKIHPVFVDLLHGGSGHALYQPVQVHQLALPAFALVGSLSLENTYLIYF